jgi:hypothetical protein
VLRNIKLYPHSDQSVLSTPWSPTFTPSDISQELWIDFHVLHTVNLSHAVFKDVEQVVIYDWFHAPEAVDPGHLQMIEKIASAYPTKWITTNYIFNSPVQTQRFDYLWNRCRSAYLEGKPTWKQSEPANYQQWPLNWQPRSEKYLCMMNRPTTQRQRLLNLVKQYRGFYSDVSQGIVLQPQWGSSLSSTPPSRSYWDQSYISCQVESMWRTGSAVTFTEKTYDHLIQGRLVLNFGPQGYYQVLAQDGWLCPRGVDLSWDSISNNELRFQQYLQMLQDLLQRSDSDLHDLFLLNKDVIIHNYHRLREKPYDYVN